MSGEMHGNGLVVSHEEQQHQSYATGGAGQPPMKKSKRAGNVGGSKGGNARGRVPAGGLTLEQDGNVPNEIRGDGMIPHGVSGSNVVAGSVKEYRNGCIALEKARHTRIFDAQRVRLQGEERARWTYDHETRLAQEQYDAAVRMATLNALQAVFAKQRALELKRHKLLCEYPHLVNAPLDVRDTKSTLPPTGNISALDSQPDVDLKQKQLVDCPEDSELETKKDENETTTSELKSLDGEKEEKQEISGAESKKESTQVEKDHDGNDVDGSDLLVGAVTKGLRRRSGTAAKRDRESGKGKGKERVVTTATSRTRQVADIRRARVIVELDAGEVMDDLQRLENSSNGITADNEEETTNNGRSSTGGAARSRHSRRS
mmetsp:Transcript_7881/g.14293  ORF Transcript_7881/g.14293 Transcript_7881/m.14293 type:complete len:374 (-) Transcript_7881:414-1535(-)